MSIALRLEFPNRRNAAKWSRAIVAIIHWIDGTITADEIPELL